MNQEKEKLQEKIQYLKEKTFLYQYLTKIMQNLQVANGGFDDSHYRFLSFWNPTKVTFYLSAL